MATPGFYAAIKTGTMKRSYHAGVNRVGVSDRPNELWQKEARDVE